MRNYVYEKSDIIYHFIPKFPSLLFPFSGFLKKMHQKGDYVIAIHIPEFKKLTHVRKCCSVIMHVPKQQLSVCWFRTHFIHLQNKLFQWKFSFWMCTILLKSEIDIYLYMFEVLCNMCCVWAFCKLKYICYPIDIWAAHCYILVNIRLAFTIFYFLQVNMYEYTSTRNSDGRDDITIICETVITMSI